jgi:hypothetical protein
VELPLIYYCDDVQLFTEAIAQLQGWAATPPVIVFFFLPLRNYFILLTAA